MVAEKHAGFSGWDDDMMELEDCTYYVYHFRWIQVDPLVIKRGKLGNPLEIGFSIGKSPTNGLFSIAMFDCRRGTEGEREREPKYIEKRGTYV